MDALSLDERSNENESKMIRRDSQRVFFYVDALGNVKQPAFVKTDI